MIIERDGVNCITTHVPASPAAPYDVSLQALIGLGSDSLSNLFVLRIM